MPSRNDRIRNARDGRSAKPPPESLYEHPSDGCPQEEYFVELDPEYQIVERVVYHEGRIAEFAMILVRVGPSRHTEVYSVDTKHGYLHQHTHGHARPNDKQDVMPLFSQFDVEESWDTAYGLVKTKYSRLE